MKAKYLAFCASAGVLAITAIGIVQPDLQSTTAMMPHTPIPTAVDVQLQADLASQDAARTAAEAARHEVPAVVAAREEAARIAQEQARQEAEQAARAAAEAAAAEAAAAKAAAAKAAAAEAAAAKAAPAPAAAPAPSSPRTSDSGIAASTYTGPLYNSAYEGTRMCIVKKESGGNYGIVSSNGSYHGAYQFSRPTGDATAKRMGRPDLVGVPVSSWSRYDQDTAFWTLWNNGAGRGNWPTAAGC